MRVIRRVLLLLLASNLLLMLWYGLRPDIVARSDAGASALAGSDGVLVLGLLEEQGGGQVLSDQDLPLVLETLPADDLISAPVSAPALAPMSCYLLGDFATESDALALMGRQPWAAQLHIRQVEAEGGARYRARTAPAIDRPAALQLLADVRGAIERADARIDTYLMTTGPVANAVSLGLFSAQSNALNVQRILAGQGVEIVVEQENQLESRFAIVFLATHDIEINREEWSSRGLDLALGEASENLCETIAQAE